MNFDVLHARDFVQALFGESHPVWDPFIRVRGSSNGLTDHCGRDGCRGLLMHAGLLFVVVCCCSCYCCCCCLLLSSSGESGGGRWSNPAEVFGQLVFSPNRLI